jgi:hypothetical protein
LANPPYGPPGQPGGWQQPGPQQYPPQQPPPYPQAPVGPHYETDKGFFGSLFDFSFDNFIAPKLVKFLYVLSLIGATIYAIFLLIFGLAALGGGTDSSAGVGLLAIIGAPILWFVWLILARLYLELVIVMFKISEDVRDIRDSGSVR